MTLCGHFGYGHFQSLALCNFLFLSTSSFPVPGKLKAWSVCHVRDKCTWSSCAVCSASRLETLHRVSTTLAVYQSSDKESDYWTQTDTQQSCRAIYWAHNGCKRKQDFASAQTVFDGFTSPLVVKTLCGHFGYGHFQSLAGCNFLFLSTSSFPVPGKLKAWCQHGLSAMLEISARGVPVLSALLHVQEICHIAQSQYYPSSLSEQ
ncbi:uncharacterized protein LOC108708226 [Xenopus laevis]|uniref:Uncharacterized protein LOC108708226 n=1 Tax=Xenopus laevis TaxID=8355 RepID=A0A8J1MAH9_XENLA|nr:uncharacterized protein LOC108708226 [Xenopus laevis]